MLTRRLFCGCLPLAAAAFVATRAAATGADDCVAFTPDRQQAVSPSDAIAKLKAGNERFAAGKTINCDLMEQVKQTAGGQAPFATILGCIDSRVPPELIFDQRIGDVFCARVAGNVVNPDMIGSLEFATKVVGSRAIVLLGHSECGAIKGAIDNVQLGDLTGLLDRIKPAVEATKTDGERTSKNKAFVQAVADNNARMGADLLRSQSPILDGLVKSGELQIVSAMHDVSTGKVQWF